MFSNMSDVLAAGSDAKSHFTFSQEKELAKKIKRSMIERFGIKGNLIKPVEV